MEKHIVRLFNADTHALEYGHQYTRVDNEFPYVRCSTGLVVLECSSIPHAESRFQMIDRSISTKCFLLHVLRNTYWCYSKIAPNSAGHNVTAETEEQGLARIDSQRHRVHVLRHGICSRWYQVDLEFCRYHLVLRLLCAIGRCLCRLPDMRNHDKSKTQEFSNRLPPPTFVLLYIATSASAAVLFVPLFYIPLYFSFVHDASAIDSHSSTSIRLFRNYKRTTYAQIWVLHAMISGFRHPHDCGRRLSLYKRRCGSHFWGYTCILGVGVGISQHPAFSITQTKVHTEDPIPDAVGFVSPA